MSTLKDQTELLVLRACSEYENGDSSILNTIVSLILEAYEAKAHLRQKGYGVIGTGLLNTCKEVPPYGLAFIPDPDPIKEDVSP